MPTIAGDVFSHGEQNGANAIVLGVDAAGASPIASIMLAPSKSMCNGCLYNAMIFMSDSGITVSAAPGITFSGGVSQNETGLSPWILPLQGSNAGPGK